MIQKNMHVLLWSLFHEATLSLEPLVLLVYVPKSIAGSEKRKNGKN